MSYIQEGGYFPHPDHVVRMSRYHTNKHLVKGNHEALFNNTLLNDDQLHMIYVATNLPNIIAKKSADFLFGETPVFSAGKENDSPEQKAIERLVEDNELHISNYESAYGNAYRGDSFYKIRYGQKYGGLLPVTSDPFKVFIEAQKPEYVIPEPLKGDSNTIYAYHVCVPSPVNNTGDEEWILKVESHYPNKIQYSAFKMSTFNTSPYENAVTEWLIGKELVGERREVETGVPFPLIVHVPNYSTDDSWEGIDDLTENIPLFKAINNRLSRIGEILDKHSDPVMVVPDEALDVDENGEFVFHAGRDKVIGVDNKESVIPQYITWNGQLDACFKELEFLIDQLLTVSELPPVALGKDNSGTSGASGLSIKWRMNSLLAKVNRKRQYYNKGLKQVLHIAQLLEHAKLGKQDYQITIPYIQFKDGLPDDPLELSTIASVRTAGKPIQSQLSAIMETRNLNEEQARIELERIREEEKADGFVDPTIFNKDES